MMETIRDCKMYTSSYVAAQYVKKNIIKNPYSDKVLVIGMDGLKEELEELDIEIKMINESPSMSGPEFSNIKYDPTIKAVVCGRDDAVTFSKMCMASFYINNAHD